MDISFIIVLWIIVSIVSAITDRKKAPPPPENPQNDSNRNFTFEMPTLANDPNQYVENQEIDLAELYRQKKQATKNSADTKLKPENKNFVAEETKNIEVEISPASAMNAIILSEILDKPKALKKRR